MKNVKIVSLCVVTGLKGVTLAVTLFIVVLFMQNSNILIQKLQSYGYYNSIKTHYGLSISPDLDVSEEGLEILDKALVSFFYETNGASSVLFSLGSQVQLYNEEFITEEELELRDFVVTVNETYLMEHPIYDTNGEKIQITGKKNENYLLVPVKYQPMENELKKYYEENNTFLKYYLDDLKKMGIEEAHAQKHKTIPLNIIYMKDNQSFRIPNYSGGKLNGIIEDPMIDVITNDNVSIAQIPSYVTNQDYLIKINSPGELQNMEQILINTGLNQFVMEFASLNHQYVKELKENAIVVLLQCLIAIVLQSLIFMLEKRMLKNLKVRVFLKYLVISWGMAFLILMLAKIPFNFALVFGCVLTLIFTFVLLRRCVNSV